MTKRLLSMLLAIIIVVGMLPVTGSALEPANVYSGSVPASQLKKDDVILKDTVITGSFNLGWNDSKNDWTADNNYVVSRIDSGSYYFFNECFVITLVDPLDPSYSKTIYRLHGETFGSLPTLTRDGYSFGGWKYTSGGSVVSIAANNQPSKVFGRNYTVSLYAQWSENAADPTVAVTDVALNKETLELTVGGTETLTATVAPSDATNKNVTWTSSDATVATVDANGVVTAVGAGTATITVTTEDGSKTDTCEVTVTAATVAVTGVALDKETLELTVGDEPVQLTASVSPGDATNKNVTWTSSDATVATVDANGVVTAVGAGTATITVETEDGKFTDTCEVSVSAATVAVTGVALDKETLELTVGDDPVQLTATVTPSDATNQKVIWTSSDATVATVDEAGKVTAVGAGTATITVETEDGEFTDTCEVTVTAAAAHKHCLSVHTGCTDHGDAVTWQPWDNTTSLPTSGNYYLTTDVTLSAQRTVSGTLNLCLNGHTIKPSGSGFGAIKITGNLSLTDCQGNGKITGFTNTAAKGSAVYSKGTFTMYGGTISDNEASYYGGGVCSEGTFTMYGGTISGNTVIDVYYNDGMGGGVYSSGTFTMHGGTISDNEASLFGGGVYIAPGKQFTMSGGTIKNNKVTTTGNAQNYGGGGVYSDGTFTMSGGTIKNNKANTKGGGVCISNIPNSTATSSFAMSGGEIIGNEAPHGGGVYIDSRKQFTMNGGTISGNTAGNTNTASGGGVRVNGTFTMSNGTISGNNAAYGGGVYISPTSASFTMAGGKITGNTATTDGGGVYMYKGAKAFNLSGSPIISGNTGGNCYTYNDGTCFMTVTGALGENAEIGITTWSSMPSRPFCKPANSVDLSNYKNWFFSDSVDRAIAKNDDGSLYTKGATTYSVFFASTNDYEKAKLTVRGFETDRAAKDDIVVISPKGDAVIESVTASGNLAVTDHGDGTYSFTMPTTTVIITVTFNSSTVDVTGVTLNKETLALTVGGAETLTATVTPSDATNKNVTWASSNTNVATVDADGNVTAVGTGTATITATAGGKSATCTVTVTASYTITFWNDGAKVEEKTVGFSEKVVAPTVTKEGHTLEGWYTEPEFTNKYNFDNLVNTDMNLYAKWTEVVPEPEYTITFSDGSSVISTVTGAAGTEVEAPADPSKEGYTFDGWDVEVPESISGNLTITAKWKINQYTITFDTDGGSEIAAITQDYGTAVTAPANPTKAGHTFAGWEPALPETMPAEDMTVKAQWTPYKLTFRFDANGGVGDTMENLVVSYGETKNLTANAYTKDGYSFAGWTTESDGSGDFYANQAEVQMNKEENATITLWAKWSKNQTAVTYYVVSYDANGGSGTMASVDVQANTVLTLPANGFKAPSGKTFKCWNINGTEYAAGKDVVITADTTVKAMWKNQSSADLDYVPAAGDNAPVFLWTCLAFSSALALFFLFVLGKKYAKK